ncbi:hypothetical protein CISIN_1g0458262mg, partial [Citrus sinensis]
MRGYTFYEGAIRAFQDRSLLSKILVIGTV